MPLGQQNVILKTKIFYDHTIIVSYLERNISYALDT